VTIFATFSGDGQTILQKSQLTFP